MRTGVIFASRHGGTREIAESIAEELVACGLEVELLEAAEVENLGRYDAVVLGSAIYAGRWLKPARRLLARHSEQLAQKPLWLFSSGPLGEPSLPEDPEPAAVSEAAKDLGARDHVVFGGKLEPDGLKNRERLLVNALKAPFGDWREWDAIREWAGRAGRELARG